jgi:hypothetical protein
MASLANEYSYLFLFDLARFSIGKNSTRVLSPNLM